MKSRGKMQISLYLLGFAGAAVFTILLIRQGAGSIGAAMAKASWGIAAIALFHLLPISLDAVAWQVLFPKTQRPRLQTLFWTRWIGESVSNLVPSAMIGGDLIRARLIGISGTPMIVAVASVIVDVTLGVPMQIIFTLLGLALLVDVTGQTNLIGPTLLGTIVGIVAIVGFYFAQRLGMFRFLSRMIARLAKSEQWTALVESGEALDQTVRSYYLRRRGVVSCWFWTLISLVASSGEIWIALRALGADATFLNAFVLQSMAMTVRSAAFAVPGQLGVQEGGYLIIGNVLGIPGDIAFAISLLARCRDLAVGIPGLAAWQIIEGRMFFRRRRSGTIL